MRGQINPESSAFPAPSGAGCYGVDIRTYMATALMAGALADSSEERITSTRALAQAAVQCADFLIEELNKPKPTPPTS